MRQLYRDSAIETAAVFSQRRNVRRTMERIENREILPRGARWSTCVPVLGKSVEQLQQEWHWFFFRNEIPDEAA